MQGEPVMQHLLNIHFYAPRLWERVRERPAMLYFVFNADVIAVLVAHDLRHGEMVAQASLLCDPASNYDCCSSPESYP